MNDNLSNRFGFDISSGIQMPSLSDNLSNSLETDIGSETDISSGMLNSVGVTPNMVASLKIASETNPFLIWIYTTLYYIVIICIVVLINCNIFFLIRHASDEKLMNLWFPTKCNEYPFGTGSNPTCPLQPESVAESVAALAPKLDTVFINDNKKEKRYWFSNLIYKDTINPDFPYDRYHKAGFSGVSTHKEITNWFVLALSDTNIYKNEFNRTCLKRLESVADNTFFEYLIFCFGIILLLLIPINLVITGGKLLFNQITGFFDLSLFSMLLTIIFLPLSTLAWIGLYTMYSQIILAIKLMFYPLLMGQWTELYEIFNTHKNLMVNIIGLAAIIALWQTPFNPDYSFIVKLVPTLLHIFFIIVKAVEYHSKGASPF